MKNSLLSLQNSFNSFPVASGPPASAPGWRRRSLSILSQLLRWRGGSTPSSPWSPFQFFPSCFVRRSARRVLSLIPAFNSFPVASVRQRKLPRQRFLLSILSQLLLVYRHPSHGWLLRPDFQFFPSCFREDCNRPGFLHGHFQFFPSCFRAPAEGGDVRRLLRAAPFNSFPVASLVNYLDKLYLDCFLSILSQLLPTPR